MCSPDGRGLDSWSGCGLTRLDGLEFTAAAALVRRAGPGERTFLQRFSATTGITPHRWRVERRFDRV